MDTNLKLTILLASDSKTFTVEIIDERYPFALPAGGSQPRVLPAKHWNRADISQSSLSCTFPSTYEGIQRAKGWIRTILSSIVQEETALQALTPKTLEGPASSLLVQLHHLFA